MGDFKGPIGLLGIPPRNFREANLGIFTSARPTQVGIEVWVTTNPTLRQTQIGLEVWGQLPPPSALTATATSARLGPVGLLGIPPRKFRDASLEIATFAPPLKVVCTQIGFETWITTNPKEICTQVGLEVWCKLNSQTFTPPPFLWVVT